MKTVPNPELIDDENPELDDAWFASAKKAKDVLPPALYTALTDKSKPVKFVHVTDEEHAKQIKTMRKQEGTRSVITEEKINVRLSSDVLTKLRATGENWQTRMNAILREAVEAGKV